jgi:hypothetical protein
MFFKRKISVSEYCGTRLDLLFSSQQTELWLKLKYSWPDNAIVSANDDLYLTHLRAAHIEVLSMAVTKKYIDMNISIEMANFINNFLDNHAQSRIKYLLPLYNRALAALPQDGILGIAQFLAEQLSQNNSSQDTVLAFGGQLYGALESIRADFKQIKLVPDPNVSIL